MMYDSYEYKMLLMIRLRGKFLRSNSDSKVVNVH